MVKSALGGFNKILDEMRAKVPPSHKTLISTCCVGAVGPQRTRKKRLFVVVCAWAQSLHSGPTLRFLDGSPPGSSVHGILQARILEWVAVPSCRGSS